MEFSSIQECFSAGVRSSPDADAVVWDGGRLTYRELADRAARLAGRLRAEGATTGTAVAILMPRSPDLVVAIIGVLMTGGYYVPLHDAYPPHRRQQVLDDVGAEILLTAEDTPATALPRIARVLRVGVDGDATPVTAHRGVPRDRAYVMYTSGTQGTPLGVAVDHRGILGLALDRCWHRDRQRRVLMVAPHAFGVSTYELWVPLLTGGTLVLAPPGPMDAGMLRATIARHAVTAVHITAGLFRVLAESTPECLRGLHEVLTGGDTISATAVRRVLDACPRIIVRAMYGATEVSSFATGFPMTAGNPPGARVPVGRPLEDVRTYILDELLQPVVPGEVGDLYVAGERLAAGYPAHPGLTALRFVADPFAGGGRRMYRTGDLARETADGLIEHAGRATDQVKLRGYRVEPAEIEHVLVEHPAVVDAIVVAPQIAPGERRLVGYLVGTGLDVVAVRAWVAGRLPEYMVPADLVVLDSLPLTPNGKVDRRALPQPPPPAASAWRPPCGARQETLCALFADVLRVSRVGLDDSFFDLDGQSLLAVRLVSRINTSLGVRITVADLFDAPTVAELDQLIAKAQDTGDRLG